MLNLGDDHIQPFPPLSNVADVVPHRHKEIDPSRAESSLQLVVGFLVAFEFHELCCDIGKLEDELRTDLGGHKIRGSRNCMCSTLALGGNSVISSMIFSY